MKLEIRNELNKNIYVALCQSILGNYFLHIDDKKSKHIPFQIKPHDYLIIDKPVKEIKDEGEGK